MWPLPHAMLTHAVKAQDSHTQGRFPTETYTTPHSAHSQFGAQFGAYILRNAAASI